MLASYLGQMRRTLLGGDNQQEQLYDTYRREDALSVQEVELSTLRRGASPQVYILAVQNNLANGG